MGRRSEFLVFIIIMINITGSHLKKYDMGKEIHYGSISSSLFINDILLPCSYRGEIIMYKKDNKCGYCSCLEEGTLTSHCIPCNLCDSELQLMNKIQLYRDEVELNDIEAFTIEPSTTPNESTPSEISEFTSSPTEISEFTSSPTEISEFTSTPSEVDEFTSTSSQTSEGTSTPSDVTEFTSTPTKINESTSEPSLICLVFPKNIPFNNPFDPCQMCICHNKAASKSERSDLEVKCTKIRNCSLSQSTTEEPSEKPNHYDSNESFEEKEDTGHQVKPYTLTAKNRPLANPSQLTAENSPLVKAPCNDKTKAKTVITPQNLPVALIINDICTNRTINETFVDPLRSCYLCICTLQQGLFVVSDCKFNDGCIPGKSKPLLKVDLRQIYLNKRKNAVIARVKKNRKNNLIHRFLESKIQTGPSTDKSAKNLLVDGHSAEEQRLIRIIKILGEVFKDQSKETEAKIKINKVAENVDPKLPKNNSENAFSKANDISKTLDEIFRDQSKEEAAKQKNNKAHLKFKPELPKELPENEHSEGNNEHKEHVIMRVTDGARCLYDGDKYADNCAFCTCFKSEDGKLYAQCAGEQCD